MADYMDPAETNQTRRLRLQLDEDCQATALAAALQQHGIDTVTTNAAGLRGVDDGTQLRETLSAEEMKNRLEWLNAWSAG